LKLIDFDAPVFLVAGFISLLFIGITTALLVADLDRPERFLTILFRPQWKSWLARGAFILVGFSIVTGLWWLLEAGAFMTGWIPAPLAEAVRPFALWVGLPLAAGAAIYTAFLFGQAEGRDLWQSSLLPFHLIVQAMMGGSGALLAINVLLPIGDSMKQLATLVFLVSLIVDLFITLLGEFGMPHASEVAARAAHDISHGRYKNHFWWGSIALGHIVPLALLFPGLPLLSTLAALCSMVGLYFFEYAFVMAPQDIPNS
jgi:formate-dependent nitrite reductase membrane component NrfD